jgi:hypothetical protein
MSAEIRPLYHGEGGTGAEEQGGSMIALVDCYTRALPYGVFTIDASGEEVPLLFSFQEQGELCLHPAAPEKGWRPKEGIAGDSVSSLLGLARGWRRRRSVHFAGPRGNLS